MAVALDLVLAVVLDSLLLLFLAFLLQFDVRLLKSSLLLLECIGVHLALLLCTG